MLLKGYKTEIFLPTCNSHFQSLHCIAHLDEDVGQVIPYLNAVLGGDTFIKDPPSVTFNMHGKLLTVHSRRIAVNALRDEAEAHSILEWLKKQINEAVKEAETKGPPPVDTIFDDVTGTMTPQLEEQKRRFLDARKK